MLIAFVVRYSQGDSVWEHRASAVSKPLWTLADVSGAAA